MKYAVGDTVTLARTHPKHNRRLRAKVGRTAEVLYVEPDRDEYLISFGIGRDQEFWVKSRYVA